MTQIWVQRVPEIAPEIVYYSELWYSTHFHVQSDEYTSRYIEDHVARHTWNLRLLSILFPSLYIPRTHVITQFHEVTERICELTLKSPEYAYFRDIQFVYSSHYPGLDAQSDTERITSRVAQFSWLYQGHLRHVGLGLGGTRSIKVDSLKESKSNVTSFADAISVMQMFDRDTARAYSDIVKDANTPDIPFFHEKFLHRLFEKLDSSYVEKFWKETNSIYLLSGLPDATNVVSYYNPKFESPNYRFIGDRFDRLLYAPDVFRAFLSLFLSGELIFKLLHTGHLALFGDLRDEKYGSLFREFREKYFAMICEISKATWILEKFPESTNVDLKALFASYLSGKLEGLADFSMDLTSDLAKLSGAGLDGREALIGPIINAVRKPVAELFRKATWRARHPEITRFIGALRQRLAKM